MRVSLVSYGTRGDVQPFVSLGAALAERGHEVTVVLPRNGAAMARAARLPLVELPCDVQEMFDSPAAQEMLAAGRINRFFSWLREEEKAYLEAMRAALLEGTEGAEAIVSHGLTEDRCAAIAAARGAAMLSVHFCPALPTRRFPSPLLVSRSLGPLNRASHRLALNMLWRLSREDVATLRAELALPPAPGPYTGAVMRGEGTQLLAFSPSISPRPPDYPAGAISVGALTPSPQLRRDFGEAGLPADLEAWLEAGPPPVFLGFGSMPVLDVERLLTTVRASLAATGARAVLGAGWSDLGEVRDEAIFSVDGVDHGALLPRCAAAVHHGGAGTVHASLAAGVPTLVCSVFADQPYWGGRCRALGVGTTFPFKRLDERRLTAGLRIVLDAGVRVRAAELARGIAAEAPVPRAIAAIEQGASGRPSARI